VTLETEIICFFLFYRSTALNQREWTDFLKCWATYSVKPRWNELRPRRSGRGDQQLEAGEVKAILIERWRV